MNVSSSTLRRLLDRSLEPELSPADLYTQISWPGPPADRPYVYINMASTADGKIVVGEINGPSLGVGGPTDQILFRRLQQRCEAAMTGGTTLRAGNVIYPPEIPRFTLTKSGDIPLDNRFFTDAPDRAYVFAPESLPKDRQQSIGSAAHLVSIGEDSVDLTAAMKWMRAECGIKVLLCEGGPAVNYQMISAGLVDELFLTVAPKVKGGARIPSIVTGEGYPPGVTQKLELISVYCDEDELYLRYKIA